MASAWGLLFLTDLSGLGLIPADDQIQTERIKPKWCSVGQGEGQDLGSPHTVPRFTSVTGSPPYRWANQGPHSSKGSSNFQPPPPGLSELCDLWKPAPSLNLHPPGQGMGLAGGAHHLGSVETSSATPHTPIPSDSYALLSRSPVTCGPAPGDTAHWLSCE